MTNSRGAIRSNSFQSIMAYGLPILALAAAVVLAFTALNKEFEHSRLAFAAAIVAALASLVTAITQHRREVAIDRLNEQAEKREQDNLALGAEIKKLQEANVALTTSVNNNLTGGHSFALVYFPVRDGKRLMTIRHFGENPLRDIRIEVLTHPPQMRLLDRFAYPSLPPKAIETIKPLEINLGDRFTFQVPFTSANGFWFEIVKAVKSGNDTIFALQARTLDKILHTEVHPKFPRDEKGEVDWSFGTVDISSLEPVKETLEEDISRSLGMA